MNDCISLHIQAFSGPSAPPCAAFRLLTLVAVGSRNACTAPPSRLRRAVLPHTKTLAVFPPANPRDRTRLWARVARVQRRQSSRGRPPSSLVANPFPWPCCYRFNPPVAAALPPLLHSSASPPATARSSSTTVPSVVIHSLFAQNNRLSSRRYTLVPSLAPTFPSSTLLDTTRLPREHHLSLGFRPSHPFLLRISDTTDGRPPDDQTRERPSSPHIARSPPPHPASAVCWDANPRRDSGSRPVHSRRRIAPDESQDRLPFSNCHRAVDPRTSRWLPPCDSEHHRGPTATTRPLRTQDRKPAPGRLPLLSLPIHIRALCLNTTDDTSLESVPPRSTQGTRSTPSRATETTL